jgi:hypothetical protein
VVHKRAFEYPDAADTRTEEIPGPIQLVNGSHAYLEYFGYLLCGQNWGISVEERQIHSARTFDESS